MRACVGECVRYLDLKIGTRHEEEEDDEEGRAMRFRMGEFCVGMGRRVCEGCIETMWGVDGRIELSVSSLISHLSSDLSIVSIISIISIVLSPRFPPL